MPNAISNTSPLFYLHRGGVFPQLFNEGYYPTRPVM